MSKHTPEPWMILYRYNVMDSNADGCIAACGGRCSNFKGEQLEAENVANAARIVACVNACTGMIDPAAEIAALREQVRRLTAEKTDMCNRNALLRARPDVPTERLAEHNRLATEMDQLREAVKLLGDGIIEIRKQRTYEYNNKLLPGGCVSSGMEQACKKIMSNPIAAAAVRGEQ